MTDWTKIPCGCYVEWNGNEWRIAASSFTCDHEQGDRADDAPPNPAPASNPANVHGNS